MVSAALRWSGTLAMVLVCATVQQGFAQEADPNARFTNEVIVVPLEGHTISALVTRKPDATKFTHAVAIFPGSPGHGNLRVEDGEIKYDNQRGNFLVRARRYFVEEGFLTVVIDAPSDYQTGLFPYSFRASARYGEDVKAVLNAVAKRFGTLDWTFAGHSEGTVSATYAGRMASPYVMRIVLASSLTRLNYQEPGLSISDFKQVNVPVLWVHHKNDPCRWTPYSYAKDLAQATYSPLLTVYGSKNGRGGACKPFTEHGFVGMEEKTVKAIVAWIRTGQVPPDVSE
ncbi:MAG TPA: hypothetical protein VK138_15360 [Acidiferrobacterales bacterium]|nr:hypothetical protein [Acidiferrobacterales bacterium]